MKPTPTQDPRLMDDLSKISSLNPVQRDEVQKAVLFVRQQLEPALQFTASFDLQVTTGLEVFWGGGMFAELQTNP